MTASLRATTSAYDNTAGLAVTIPASVQPGDALLLAFGIADGAATIATPSGWTSADARTDSGDKWVLFSKVAASGDGGSTVTVSVTGQAAGAHMGAILYAAQGTDTSSPFSVVQGATDATSSASHNAPNATTAVDGCLMVAIMLDRAGAQSTNFTATSGWTVQQQLKPSYTVSVMEGCVADRAAGTAGPVTGPTLTATATSTHTALWTVALSPATTVQTARPVSDVTTSGWTAVPTATPVAANLADQSDSTYVESPTSPSASVLEVKLPTLGAAPATVTSRFALAGGAVSGTVVTSLRQGTGTEIASWTEANPTSTPTTYVYALTPEQQAAVTDLTDVRIRTVVTAA